MDALRIMKYFGTVTSDGKYRLTLQKYRQHNTYSVFLRTIRAYRTLGLSTQL